jgi:hypothetical protein
LSLELIGLHLVATTLAMRGLLSTQYSPESMHVIQSPIVGSRVDASLLVFETSPRAAQLEPRTVPKI